MKTKLSPALLPPILLIAGIIGALLRLWLNSLEDDWGLLPVWHIADILCWVLTLAAVAAVIWGTFRLTQAPKYSFNFPASPIGGIGTALAAVGFLVNAILSLLTPGDALLRITAVLGLFSAVSLGFLGWFRWKGIRPNVIFHGLVTLYLMLLLVCQYRMWSAQPQMQTYVFQLFATVCLMISAFQRACFDVGVGHRRIYAIFRLSAGFFCLLSIPGSDFWILYLTCGLWSLTDLCDLRPMPSRKG